MIELTRAKRLALLCAFWAASIAARGEMNPKACAWQSCGVGDVVITTPSALSTPSCARQGVTLYVAYVTHPGLPPGEKRERVETELRLQAGVRNFSEAMKLCRTTPAGQRVKVTAVGAAKTGLLQVDSEDGTPGYWVSVFDLSKP